MQRLIEKELETFDIRVNYTHKALCIAIKDLEDLNQGILRIPNDDVKWKNVLMTLTFASMKTIADRLVAATQYTEEEQKKIEEINDVVRARSTKRHKEEQSSNQHTSSEPSSTGHDDNDA